MDPVHDVWLSDGLTGRASHVFDLVDVGNRKASQVAAAGGMGRDAARDALAALVDVGLLEKQGTAYTVPVIALIEIPQACSLKFLTCEQRSV